MIAWRPCQRLDAQARALEQAATGPSFDSFIADERARSRDYGGRTVFASVTPGSGRHDQDG